MTTHGQDGAELHGAASEAGAESHQAAHAGTNDAVTIAATVGGVAVVAALFEVALLPGMALGVCAVLAPKFMPKLGSAMSPMFRSSVRGIYKLGQKTREMMAEAKEQVHDIVAEVHAEGTAPKDTATPAPHV